MPKLNEVDLFYIERVLNKTIMEDYKKRIGNADEIAKIYLDDEIAILNNIVAKVEAMQDEMEKERRR